jgi:hypothetical protein
MRGSFRVFNFDLSSLFLLFPDADMFQLLAYLIGLFGFTIALTVLLRRSRVPGAGLLAGVIAGFLLGPSLLGKLAPDWFERTIIGGREERQTLEELRTERQTRALALREAGIASRESSNGEQSEIAIAAAEETWSNAQWRDQQALRLTTLVACGLLFLLAGATRPAVPGPRSHPYQLLSVGVWSAILPGALFLIILRWLDIELAPALAAAAAIECGALVFAHGDLAAADEAEVGGARLVVNASRIAFLLALAALCVASILYDTSTIPLIIAPASAAILGWILPRVEQRPVIACRDFVLLPIAAALLAVRIEFFEHLSLWMIVAAMVLSGDGRWFGAFLGAMLSGARRSLRTMRLVLGVMSAGGVQVALAAIALSAGVVPEEAAYALLAGTLLMEITTNARRTMARQIEEAEIEVDELRARSE